VPSFDLVRPPLLRAEVPNVNHALPQAGRTPVRCDTIRHQMRAEQWLQIAEIVSTGLLTFFTVLLTIATVLLTVVTYNAHRDQQRTPLPWSIRLLGSPWIQSPWRLPPLSILAYFVGLIIDLLIPGPVTRSLIFSIAFNVAGAFWGAVWMLANIIRQELRSQADTIRELRGIQSDIVSILQGINHSQAEINRDIVEALKTTAPGEALRTMLDVMGLMNAELEKVKQKTERRTGITGLFRR
jgi:hypothetical protein